MASESCQNAGPRSRMLRDMKLDPTACYRAVLARDRRFDGRFFTGVTSTGIYCRPVCRVRPPRLEHCRFFLSAAAAQAAGFRPCLRCCPEVAPHSPRWRGSSVTVQRALRLLAERDPSEQGVAGLAERLGVGERHLRRLFAQHLGASPVEVAQAARLLLAKQLLDGTELPMTQVALAAGYRSQRRFNDAIRKTYQRSARELRRARSRSAAQASPALLLRLGYREPFHWRGMLEFLAARAIPGVEEVCGASYRRVIDVPGAVGLLEAEPAGDGTHLRVQLHLPGTAPLLSVTLRLRDLFDLDADSAAIDRDLGADPLLRAVVRRHAGTRVPGAWNAFELAVRAILGQQITVRGASTLAGRLAEKFGLPLRASLPGSTLRVAFPSPEQLAEADLEGIGLTRARAAAIRALASRAAHGEVLRDPYLEPERTAAELRAIPGIGEWTASYLAMRVARDPDAFLHGDLAVKRALSGEPGLRTPARILTRAEAWRPWRAYAVMYLWLAGAPAARPADSESARAPIRARRRGGIR